MFLRNVWYAGGWSDELGDEKLLSRTIADQRVVFWRDSEHQPQAILDRCPHRAAPLSLGKRVADGVQCGYHGLVFDGTGTCIANPHGATVAALRTRSFPLAERHNLIWIWMGAPDQADVDLIPDLGILDRAPPTAYSKGLLPTAASHQLVADNILDLTHADYLHATTLGGGAMTRSKPKVVENENSTLFVEWLVENDVAQPFFQNELPHPDHPADIWMSVLWHPNSVMLLRAGATNTGRSREEGADTWAAHIATPETEFSTHYFYANTREYRVHDADYNKLYADAMHYAFSVEDKTMLEAQQHNLGNRDLFDTGPVLLQTDSASTQARRLLKRLIDRETETETESESESESAKGRRGAFQPA
jgi:vanillate O-demethylase monooxygenase subunit